MFQQEDQLRVLVSAPAADEPTVGGEKSFFSFRIFTGEYAIILNTLFKALLTLLGSFCFMIFYEYRKLFGIFLEKDLWKRPPPLLVSKMYKKLFFLILDNKINLTPQKIVLYLTVPAA